MLKIKKDMSKITQQVIMFLSDLFAISAVAILALLLRFDMNFSLIPQEYLEMLESRLIVIVAVHLAMLLIFRLYSCVWQFAGVGELIRILAATAIAQAVIVAYSLLLSSMLPPAFYVFNWLLTMLVIGGLRLGYRIISKISLRMLKHRDEYERVMLIGAGRMGTMMIEELINEEFIYGKPVILVDDDAEKKGKQIKGVKIAGNCDDIPKLAKSYYIDKIIFCVPSASLEARKRILDIALSTGCRVKVAQSIHGSLRNDAEMNNVRDVDVADLLARPVVSLDSQSCSYIHDQVVLVTGGGGSIGSELCRQVARCSPKQIIIFDIYENNAYELLCELKDTYGETIDIQIRVGSVRDTKRLEQIFTEFKPAIVFHAAAHKHVPMMEDSPCEAVKNNVFGTLYTAKAASKFGVSRFILLSTDKAVNPTSVMGASKRITEMIIQAVNWHNKTIFAAVRFGNVLGSNGSVIPIFKKQIEKGGPVTVTHPDITRYFMTIPEAAQLVVQAGGLAEGGEIFVLDMGEPVKIMDLAYNLIKLSGLVPDVDIKIEITGLRPG
ncbi:MAG: polysaccharide biosynthesis protein, partial [Clostridiales bacterium]|nr:polysaccharide biosynthesis protein [Clostridiales bacterium]